MIFINSRNHLFWINLLLSPTGKILFNPFFYDYCCFFLIEKFVLLLSDSGSQPTVLSFSRSPLKVRAVHSHSERMCVWLRMFPWRHKHPFFMAIKRNECFFNDCFPPFSKVFPPLKLSSWACQLLLPSSSLPFVLFGLLLFFLWFCPTNNNNDNNNINNKTENKREIEWFWVLLNY